MSSADQPDFWLVRSSNIHIFSRNCSAHFLFLCVLFWWKVNCWFIFWNKTHSSLNSPLCDAGCTVRDTNRFVFTTTFFTRLSAPSVTVTKHFHLIPRALLVKTFLKQVRSEQVFLNFRAIRVFLRSHDEDLWFFKFSFFLIRSSAACLNLTNQSNKMSFKTHTLWFYFCWTDLFKTPKRALQPFARCTVIHNPFIRLKVFKMVHKMAPHAVAAKKRAAPRWINKSDSTCLILLLRRWESEAPLVSPRVASLFFWCFASIKKSTDLISTSCYLWSR